SIEQIVAALTKGQRPDGRILAPIMPWRAFANLTPADAQAIAAYLKTLPAVSNRVPGPFGPDDQSPSFVMKIVPPKGKRLRHHARRARPRPPPPPTQDHRAHSGVAAQGRREGVLDPLRCVCTRHAAAAWDQSLGVGRMVGPMAVHGMGHRAGSACPR